MLKSASQESRKLRDFDIFQEAFYNETFVSYIPVKRKIQTKKRPATEERRGQGEHEAEGEEEERSKYTYVCTQNL